MSQISIFPLLPHHQQNPRSPPYDRNVAVYDQNEEDDTDPFQFDPLSPPNACLFVPNPSNSPFSETESNPDSIRSDGEYSDSAQMNFDNGILSPAEEYPCSNFASCWLDGDIGLGLGAGDVAELGELGQMSITRGDDSGIGGHWIVRLESDSYSEGFASPADPFFWNGVGIGEESGGGNVDLEWEEVEDHTVFERDGLGLVIERIDELSLSSEISNIGREEMGDGIEEGDRDLEWEFLLAVNNLERNLEFESESFGEYDELIGQLMENGSVSKGSPPAAKSIVENLLVVVFSEEELREDNVVCAVCKDDILAEDKVTKLPCCHFYHGDCIVPWLGIRNTCPICRYELPTDDPDYEQRKSHGGGVDLSRDLLIRYTLQSDILNL